MTAPWEVFTSNRQWEQYLKNLLRTNNVALLRATVLVYNNQTDEEKYHGECLEDNNVGFTKYDVHILSSIALKIKHGRTLSKSEMYILRDRMPKYWKQLMVASKAKMAKKYQVIEGIQMEMSELEAEEPPKPALVHLERCSDQGIACEYGICSECPNANKAIDKIK